MCAVFSLLLILDGPFVLLTLFAVMARLSIAGAFATTYLYTPEVYPTQVRATGLGIASCFSRVAALLTPFVEEYFVIYGDYIPLSAFALLSIMAGIASLMLPFETAKQELK